MTQPKQCFDLRSLSWTVAGYMPTGWMGKSMELGFVIEPEIKPVPAFVPGSVQRALREAGHLPDWNLGLHARACEWVEHREWVFTTTLPGAWFPPGARAVLRCGGLDGDGIVVLNRKKIGEFHNAFVLHEFDLTDHLKKTGNELQLVFLLPPRWLGQIGFTSQMKDWKPRFNYGWDWVPRFVQIGPWEPMRLFVTKGAEITSFRARSDWDIDATTGTLWMKGAITCSSDCCVRLALLEDGRVVRSAVSTGEEFSRGLQWSGLEVTPWWPNGEGEQKLYALRCELVDDQDRTLDRVERRVGFKNIEWRPCANATPEADPWICVVNGRPVFLQGVNWTPIRANFADLTHEDYARLITVYAGLGCNTFRVWGGGFLEKSSFYDLCDQHGILVWQEFPLSSSGHENWPHEDEPSITTLVEIARSYIARRQHHASLLMWCGGNELQGGPDGSKTGTGRPVDLRHPLMQRWKALVEEEDPGRRFMPSSASGPRFMADAKEFGQGLHWDVHGPWDAPGENAKEWMVYWKNDDALFRSETGVAGASGAELLRRYDDGLPLMPPNGDNPLWRRFGWWLQWKEFLRDNHREPASLEEFVDWSQSRQMTALILAMNEAKQRFPGIGGMLIWMGHDAFPCTANTSIIDFEGKPKPAALGLSKIWKSAR